MSGFLWEFHMIFIMSWLIGSAVGVTLMNDTSPTSAPSQDTKEAPLTVPIRVLVNPGLDLSKGKVRVENLHLGSTLDDISNLRSSIGDLISLGGEYPARVSWSEGFPVFEYDSSTYTLDCDRGLYGVSGRPSINTTDLPEKAVKHFIASCSRVQVDQGVASLQDGVPSSQFVGTAAIAAIMATGSLLLRPKSYAIADSYWNPSMNETVLAEIIPDPLLGLHASRHSYFTGIVAKVTNKVPGGREAMQRLRRVATAVKSAYANGDLGHALDMMKDIGSLISQGKAIGTDLKALYHRITNSDTANPYSFSLDPYLESIVDDDVELGSAEPPVICFHNQDGNLVISSVYVSAPATGSKITIQPMAPVESDGQQWVVPRQQYHSHGSVTGQVLHTPGGIPGVELIPTTKSSILTTGIFNAVINNLPTIASVLSSVLLRSTTSWTQAMDSACLLDPTSIISNCDYLTPPSMSETIIPDGNEDNVDIPWHPSGSDPDGTTSRLLHAATARLLALEEKLPGTTDSSSIWGTSLEDHLIIIYSMLAFHLLVHYGLFMYYFLIIRRIKGVVKKVKDFATRVAQNMPDLAPVVNSMFKQAEEFLDSADAPISKMARINGKMEAITLVYSARQGWQLTRFKDGRPARVSITAATAGKLKTCITPDIYHEDGGELVITECLMPGRNATAPDFAMEIEEPRPALRQSAVDEPPMYRY